MVVHNKVRPFVLRSNNILMSLALGILLWVSIMNLLKAGYFESGTIPTNTADMVLEVCNQELELVAHRATLLV